MLAKLKMNAIGKKYYSVVFAILLPSISYLLYPGKVVIASTISNFILLLFLINKYKNDSLNNFSLFPQVKWWFFVSVFGIFNSLWTHTYNDELLKDSYMAIIGLIPIFLMLIIRSLDDVKNFFFPYLVISTLVAFYSSRNWAGFQYCDVPHLIVPIVMFFSLFPYLNIKSRIIIWGLCLWGFFFDLSVRSCAVIFLYSFVTSFVFFIFKEKKAVLISKIIGAIFLVSPLFFLSLNLFDGFNVFEKISELSIESSMGENKKRDNIMLDTRTVVYADVLSSTDDYYSIILGQGVATRVKTFAFDRHTEEAAYGRKSVEVGILNVYTYYGLVGVLLVIWIFVSMYYYAMYRTSNMLTRYIALYIAVRFFVFFLETPNLTPDIYIALGICLSSNIRQLTDKQISDYFKHYQLIN